MPKIAYISKKFHKASEVTIEQANELLELYRSQGFVVSLRQLYYRMLSTGKITENSLRQYKRLGKLMSDARQAGLTDWYHMEDRGRGLKGLTHWGGPNEIIQGAANGYGIDLWEGQKTVVECWFEKDALMGVFARVCDKWDVPYFSCRGYSSQSEMWRAGQRLKGHIARGMKPVILYLGDHDPSGIQMTEDIASRMDMYCGRYIEVDRLALTMDQVKQYNPHPNFAKETDSRYDSYVREYGDECWELDALEPEVLADLVEKGILARLDLAKYEKRVKRQEAERRSLRLIAAHYDEALEAAKVASETNECDQCGEKFDPDTSSANNTGSYCSDLCEETAAEEE